MFGQSLDMFGHNLGIFMIFMSFYVIYVTKQLPIYQGISSLCINLFKAGIQAFALASFSSPMSLTKLLLAHDLMKYCHSTMLKESA